MAKPHKSLLMGLFTKVHIYMNFLKKLNLHWFWQNHIFEPFSVRRACTKSYVSSEPYPRASQIWCQNVRETWKKKVIKCRGESLAHCRVIARNVEGGGLLGPPPPSLFRVVVLKLWSCVAQLRDISLYKRCSFKTMTCTIIALLYDYTLCLQEAFEERRHVVLWCVLEILTKICSGCNGTLVSHVTSTTTFFEIYQHIYDTCHS